MPDTAAAPGPAPPQRPCRKGEPAPVSGGGNAGSERSSACPEAPAQRAGAGRVPRSGSPHSPQPTARSRGGGGWRQAGFHPVNYSVANSAPRRGGRRKSESEPSHGGGGNTTHGGSQKRGASPGLGPCRSLGCSPHHVSWNPAGGPWEDRGHPGGQERGSQSQHGWRQGQVAATGQQESSSGWQTPLVPGGLPWSCRNYKWHRTSPSKAQPGLWKQSPPGQTWQGQHMKFLGSTEVLPQHRSPPGWGSRAWMWG